eukprot:363719_1
MSNTTNKEIYSKLSDELQTKLIRFRTIALNKFTSKNGTTVAISDYKKRYNKAKLIKHVKVESFSQEYVLKLMTSYEMASIMFGINMNKSVLQCIHLILISVYFTGKIQSPVFYETLKKETALKNNFLFKNCDWEKMKHILWYDKICSEICISSIVALGINNNRKRFTIKITSSDKDEWSKYGFQNMSKQQQSQCLPNAILTKPTTIRFTNKIPYNLQTNVDKRYNPRRHATDGDEQKMDEFRDKTLLRPMTFVSISTLNNTNTNNTDIIMSEYEINNTDKNLSNNLNNNRGIVSHMSLQNGVHITFVDQYTKLLSTPDDHTLTITSINVGDILLVIISANGYNQRDYIHATNICGATAPVNCKILNEDIIAVNSGCEYLDVLLFQNEEIRETDTGDAQQLISFETTIMEHLNDERNMRNSLRKIKIQIENENLNPLSDRIKHALQDMPIYSVEQIVQKNQLFENMNFVIINNAHELKNFLMDGMLPDDLTDIFRDLNKQINDYGITESFITQICFHYFNLILRKCTNKRFMFFNSDTLNPSHDTLRDSNLRPFSVLFNVIANFENVEKNQLQLIALTLLSKVLNSAYRLSISSDEFNDMMAKNFKFAINFQSLYSDYYDGTNDEELNLVAKQIVEDLSMRCPLNINELKTTRLSVHIQNVHKYVDALQCDSIAKLHNILIEYEGHMLKRIGNEDISDLKNFNNIESNGQWNRNLSMATHIFHSMLGKLQSSSSLHEIQSFLHTLTNEINVLREKLYEDLFQPYDQMVIEEVSCSLCSQILNSQ